MCPAIHHRVRNIVPIRLYYRDSIGEIVTIYWFRNTSVVIPDPLCGHVKVKPVLGDHHARKRADNCIAMHVELNAENSFITYIIGVNLASIVCNATNLTS